MRVRSVLSPFILGGVVFTCMRNLLWQPFLSAVVRLGDDSSSSFREQQSSNNAAMIPLAPVHVNSSWIGNQWYPPHGYRLYSAREIQRFFHQMNRSILIVGDSTARRMYATFYGILNATINPDDVSIHEIDHRSVIDVNKGQITERCSQEGLTLCRGMPGDPTNQFDLLDCRCLSCLVRLTQDPDSFVWRNYSLVIFILGPWEVMDSVECGAGRLGRKNQTDDIFRALFQGHSSNDTTTTTSSTTHFVWRTWGSIGTTHSHPSRGLQSWKKARAHNEYVKWLIDANEMKQQRYANKSSTVSYIDWGQAMLPRLFPEERRIAGDIDPHFGLEARLAFVQMLINHLVERARQEQLQIRPYLTNNHTTATSSEEEEHGADDEYHFLTITAPDEVFATIEEKRAFEDTKATFCPDCMWATGITCQMRMYYVQSKYNVPESKALLGLGPVCNKSSVENGSS